LTRYIPTVFVNYLVEHMLSFFLSFKFCRLVSNHFSITVIAATLTSVILFADFQDTWHSK
jgi:hypothetical protein